MAGLPHNANLFKVYHYHWDPINGKGIMHVYLNTSSSIQSDSLTYGTRVCRLFQCKNHEEPNAHRPS